VRFNGEKTYSPYGVCLECKGPERQPLAGYTFCEVGGCLPGYECENMGGRCPEPLDPAEQCPETKASEERCTPGEQSCCAVARTDGVCPPGLEINICGSCVADSCRRCAAGRAGMGGECEECNGGTVVSEVKDPDGKIVFSGCAACPAGKHNGTIVLWGDRTLDSGCMHRGSAGQGVKGVFDPPAHLFTSFHTILIV
jgi:hypothetical protein